MLQRVAQRFAGDLQQMDGLVRGHKPRRQLVVQRHGKAESGAELLATGLQRGPQARLRQLQAEGGQQFTQLHPGGVQLVADLA
ncbi:hypothetical protein D3C76_1297450 [compost metagenome]